MFNRSRTPEPYRRFGDALRVPDAELELFSRASTVLEVDAGRVLIEEGLVGNEVMAVLDGEVVVERDGTCLTTLGVGAIIGEQAVLTHDRRNATVRASTPCLVAVMTRAEFATILDGCRHLGREFLTTAIERLQTAAA